MKSNLIEDIMIDKEFDKKNKKPTLVVFIFLIIILILAGGVFWYLINVNKLTNKQLFFQAILNAKLEFFIENETYKEMAKKISNNNFEMNNDITLSSTIKKEETENKAIDFSKYLLNWKIIQNVENEENYNELNLSYSDNKVLNVKLINNKQQIAIFSDEIVNKYVGINKNNINSFLKRLGVNTELINQFFQIEKQIPENIDLDEETKNKKIEEYKNLLLNNLGEDKFILQVGSSKLSKEGSKQDIIVNAYKLSLTQEELNTVVKEFLTTLRNDEEFIKRFVTNKPVEKTNTSESNEESQNEVTNSTESLTSEESNTNNILQPVGTETNTEGQVAEETNIENQVVQEANTDEQVENNPEQQIETNLNNEQQMQFNTEFSLDTQINSVLDATKKFEQETLDIIEIVPNILDGKKANVTVEDVQKAIDNIIANLKKDGNGLEIIVYVSELATEKISIILPDKSTVDIELNSISETEKDAIITYLYEEDVVKYDENNIAVYSGAENTLPNESQAITEKQINGTKIYISKSQSDASTKIKTIFNIIENNEINKKITIDLSTKGIASSKTFNNECTLKYSNNDGEIKVNIKNDTNFDKASEIEKLNKENSLLLDELNDLELMMTTMSIMNKIQEVSESKQENMDFIDINTQSPDVSQNQKAREELRNLLISTISKQMGEAISKGEQYILDNIKNLQIQGHIVSVIIQNNIAEVNIDGLKFIIDSNFNLSDA